MKGKIIITLFLIGLVAFFGVQKVYLPEQEKLQYEAEQRQLDPATHEFEKVLAYENLYMGNFSNNAGLIEHLPPLSNIGWTYEQKPEEFKLIVNYNEAVKDIGEDKVRKGILYNAPSIFTLIKNMEIVEFAFVDETYTVTRQHVNDWFDEDVSTFNDANVFKEKVQQPLVENKRLEEWFHTYIGGGN